MDFPSKSLGKEAGNVSVSEVLKALTEEIILD